MILFRKIKSGIRLLFSGIKWACFQIGSFVRVAGQAVKCTCALLQATKKLPKTASESDAFASFLPDHGGLAENFAFPESAPSLDLSIIIATYNAENYIKDCLDSVLSQKTNVKIEVILVNDGSTDNTKEIVAPYLADPRLRYYEQENAGQSAARNFAINHSKGAYLMIVDSDDLLCPGSIDALMDLAIKTQSDIVEGGMQSFSQTFVLNTPKKIKIRSFQGRAKNKYILTSFGYSWAKVYKRELWAKVRYPVGYIFEDVISKFVLRRLAAKITTTNRIVYAYRRNPQSTSHGINRKKKLDSILVFPRIIEICRQNKTPSDRLFYLLALNHIGLLNYITTRFLEEEQRKLCFCEMQKQLLTILPPKKVLLPFWFRLLNRSILEGNYDAWTTTAETIQKYRLLKKYREIN